MNERKKSSPPGYISSEEAAQRLGVSKDRLYQWVKQARLTAYTVGNAFIFLEKEIDGFERNPTGRKRKGPPSWRVYQGEVKVLVTEIQVQVRAGQQKRLRARVEAMQKAGEYVFPGTIARYIVQGDEQLSHVQILLFWKSTEMPVEAARQTQLAMFQEDFADTLDWQTARIKTTDALTYT
ncbi:MAG TPA: helix-turn-helix domain-containing protein [Ktedonobacteraceae bacterium]|jgi:excisionase family DNA binding protein|nr:helix-turn-helix domain-containing protein [Ktedonobacteraceae bacterium]